MTRSVEAKTRRNANRKKRAARRAKERQIVPADLVTRHKNNPLSDTFPLSSGGVEVSPLGQPLQPSNLTYVCSPPPPTNLPFHIPPKSSLSPLPESIEPGPLIEAALADTHRHFRTYVPSKEEIERLRGIRSRLELQGEEEKRRWCEWLPGLWNFLEFSKGRRLITIRSSRGVSYQWLRKGPPVLNDLNAADQEPHRRFIWEEEHEGPCVRNLGRTKYNFA